MRTEANCNRGRCCATWCVRELIGWDLATPEPLVAGWRDAGLTISLPVAGVDATVRCDYFQPRGRRDRTVFLLLALLGLGSIEVARLPLNDADRRVRDQWHCRGAVRGGEDW